MSSTRDIPGPRPEATDLQLSVLGPLRAQRGQEHVTPKATKVATLLACLASAPGEILACDELIDEIWPETPPRRATAVLQVYVSHLRKALDPPERSGASVVITSGSGYLLDVTEHQLDASQFRQLSRAGRADFRQGDPAAAALRLRQALSHWRGSVFGGLATSSKPGSHLWAAASRLDEERLASTEMLIEAELGMGLHHELVAELVALTERHAFREILHRQLILALYRCGRQAEALAAYARIDSALRRELGIEPSVMLRQTHQAVLAGDTSTVGTAFGAAS